MSRPLLKISSRSSSFRTFSYKQGQYNTDDPTVREYFYCVDHNGMLFLDDARMKNFTSCFKEKKFLQFFFNRIRRTPESSTRPIHKTFPFTSYCGRERNYIRTIGTPFVFTTFAGIDKAEELGVTDELASGKDLFLEYNFSGKTQPFRPESLYVASDGRVYHSFGGSRAAGFALVRSSVADLISESFVYGEGGGEIVDGRKRAEGFEIGGKVVRLTRELEEEVEKCL